jgi:Ser/Thr protein kinase RdoA (MazF antagonist)
MAARHRRGRGERYEMAPAVLVDEVWRIPAAPATWEVAAGASGKTLARLPTADGPLCLRRYPPGASPQWLAALHQGAAYLERHGFSLYPRLIASEQGETLVHHSGHWYDLTSWIATPVTPVGELTEAQLTNLGTTIARLHQAGEGAPGPVVRFDWLSGHLLTAEQLAWDPVARGKDPWQRVENLAAFFAPLIAGGTPLGQAPELRPLLEIVQATVQWLAAHGSIAEIASQPVTLTHGSLRADNVRFTGEAVSALLDRDTLALRPPLGDLAALLTDFGRWDADRCAALVRGYRQQRPVAEESLAELPHLAALHTLGLIRARLHTWEAAGHVPTAAALTASPVAHWVETLGRIQNPESRIQNEETRGQ